MPLSAATLTAVTGSVNGDFSGLPSASFIAGLGLSGAEQSHKLLVRFAQFCLQENENQDYSAVDARNPAAISLDNEGLLGEIRMRFYVETANLNIVVSGTDLTNANGWFGLNSVDLSGVTDPLIAGTPLATNFTVPLAQVLLDWSRVLNSYDSDPSVDGYDQKIRISTAESGDGMRTGIRLEFPVNTTLAFQNADLVDFS